jgi:cation diffusion facilitator family transporter
MHTESIAQWQHTHIFGQDKIRSGERRTLIVIFITSMMMTAEIVTGLLFGSMALFADGIHMGSHMIGLGISFLAYIYARKHAHDQLFSFGTGKVNALAGFSSAIFLVFIALFMAYESVNRFIHPVSIEYNQAILVAFIGLVVNGASMLILGDNAHAHPAQDHHDHAHAHADNPDHPSQMHTHAHTKGTDQNLKAAYLHVFTDALTSILAIVALFGAKFFQFNWMDPFMGLVGAFLVINWSVGLIRATSRVLLDHQIHPQTQQKIIRALEGYKDTRVSDLHIWSIGPGIYSSEVSIVTKAPDSPDIYKALIPEDAGVVHTTIEIHLCHD